MRNGILCVGEILWDSLPEGLFLGGAPFNVARHLQMLGETVEFVSRVGDDVLGQEARRRLRAQGLDDDLVQTDNTLPTGLARVALDVDTGEPDYEIVQPAAWDAIGQTDALERCAERAAALVYGSLSQRTNPSRETIRRLWKTDALRVFDVNLRPPFDDRMVVEPSLHAADVVKLNETELDRMRTWLGLSNGAEAAMADLGNTVGCEAVCVTWGGDGAGLWMNGEYWRHPGYAVEVKDPVGAGDAFLSVLIAGLLAERADRALLGLGNRLGAYVASRSGAVPAYDVDGVGDIANLPIGKSSGPGKSR